MSDFYKSDIYFPPIFAFAIRSKMFQNKQTKQKYSELSKFFFSPKKKVIAKRFFPRKRQCDEQGKNIEQ